MNEFTLLTVLNGIKRHFLITAALFLVTLFSLPSLNIIEKKYTMQKVINVGTSPPGFPVGFLRFNEMHAIIGSSNMAELLSSTLGDDGVSQYRIDITAEENILLDLKSHEPDNLVNTANLIMKRFQEFDEISIQKKIHSSIDIPISEKRKLLELVSFSENYLSVSNADLELYASKQKIYNTALGNNEDRVESNIEIDKIINIKINETHDKKAIKLHKFKINNEISNLELIKKIGFIPVSYLYPAELKDISKYYPNDIIFFGISLLTALFYNLIMINFLYIKYNKNV